MKRVYLRWTIEFIILLILACAASLFATAAIGGIAISDVIECLIHLIYV